MNRYEIVTVGRFYEVFDNVDKITIFATSDRNKAIQFRKVLIEKGWEAANKLAPV